MKDVGLLQITIDSLLGKTDTLKQLSKEDQERISKNCKRIALAVLATQHLTNKQLQEMIDNQ